MSQLDEYMRQQQQFPWGCLIWFFVLSVLLTAVMCGILFYFGVK